MLLMVVLVALVVLNGVSLADFFLQPESYRFGTEVGGWMYRSHLHYLGSLLAELLVLSGGLVLSFFTRSPSRTLLVRLTILLMDGTFIATTALVH